MAFLMDNFNKISYCYFTFDNTNFFSVTATGVRFEVTDCMLDFSSTLTVTKSGSLDLLLTDLQACCFTFIWLIAYF